jgi:hypothetical protein
MQKLLRKKFTDSRTSEMVGDPVSVVCHMQDFE